MQRLIANLLLSWLVLLVPGATALDLAQPQQLLAACCRTHGAHHCSMMKGPVAAHAPSAPEWRSPGCPFTHLLHAALVLPPYLAAQQPRLSPDSGGQASPTAELARVMRSDAGLPGQRGPSFSC